MCTDRSKSQVWIRNWHVTAACAKWRQTRYLHPGRRRCWWGGEMPPWGHHTQEHMLQDCHGNKHLLTEARFFFFLLCFPPRSLHLASERCQRRNFILKRESKTEPPPPPGWFISKHWCKIKTTLISPDYRKWLVDRRVIMFCLSSKIHTCTVTVWKHT